MSFLGIESVMMTAPDLEEMNRFFTDWGLAEQDGSRAGAIFTTELGSRVVLKPSTARGLPAPPEQGANFREVVWGVSAKRDLDRLAKALGAEYPYTRDDDGTIHTRDPNGIAVGFRLWPEQKRQRIKPTEFNTGGSRQRIDRPAALYDRARPLRIGHIVFLVADLAAGEAFYTKRLGFRVTDRYGTDRAVFLRCSPENDHHNLFMLNSHGAKTELQHIAFEVRDIHEVFGGGVFMRQHGWATEVGPGRHPVSSAYFWYFKNPCGGAVEYFSDSDYVTDAWIPTTYNETRFSEWHVADGVGPAQGGQVAKTGGTS